jgi:hypothetical protein
VTMPGVSMQFLASAIVVLSLLLIFAVSPAAADNIQTFAVSVSNWGTFSIDSGEPVPVDQGSSITIDTTTGQVVSSQITVGGGILLPFRSQAPAGTGTDLAFGPANGTYFGAPLSINLVIGLPSLVGYTGGPMCNGFGSCPGYTVGGSIENWIQTPFLGGAQFGGGIVAVGQVGSTGPDFGLSSFVAAPVRPGQSVSYGITVNSFHGFQALVQFSVSGLPANATGSFSPNPVQVSGLGGGMTVLTVSTASTTPLGQSSLIVTGTNSQGLGNTITHSITVTLNVAAPNPIPVLYPITPSAVVAAAATPVVLDITGAGFVNGATVKWNGSPLNTQFLSSSKLRIVPPNNVTGTATVTVTNPAPGGGTSNFQYFLVQNPVAQNYFSSRDITGSVNLTSPMTGGDFNKDGNLDLIVASGPNVYVLLGNGDGTFQPAKGSNGPSNAVVTGIHVADINGDGKLDLIINGKRGTTGLVATMLGNGDGSFQPPVETDFAGAASSSMVVADFNKDGVLDVAMVSASQVRVMLGNSDGTFQNPVGSIFTTYAGRDGIAAADFYGDGNLDLVITAYDPNSTTGFSFVGVLKGFGDGFFGDINMVAGSGANFVGSITAAIGDFNNDGKLDIATGIQTAGSTIQGLIYLSLGKGDGTFSVGTSVPNVNVVTTPLLVGDFNADGVLDIATGGFFYFGLGDGTFPTSNGSGNAPTFVYAGDANNDGLLDVIDETVTTTQSRSGSTTTEAAGIELQVPPLPDFRGVVGPLNTMLMPGGSVSFNVTLTPLYGWTGDVTMGATNLPNGVAPSYNPVTVPGGNGTTTITLTAAPSVPLGDYAFNMSGNSGGVTHTTTIPLTVNNSPGDFGGSVFPDIQNIAQGGTATFPVTITPTAGFTGSVFLSVSGLPSGATASFSQNPITGGSGSSTLTITTSSGTPSPSVTAATITATSGVLVHSHTIYIGVAQTAESITGTITPTTFTPSSSAGGSTQYTLDVVTMNNNIFADMTLRVDGLPAGAAAAFEPLTIKTGSGQSVLHVVVPSGGVVPAGTYSLLVTMTEDGSIAQETITLTVGP